MSSPTSTPPADLPIAIVGAGGIGGWVALLLGKTETPPVDIWDGDKVEEKNLDRQLFGKSAIGSYKAAALIRHHKLQMISVSRYFTKTDGMLAHFFICAADNHAARLSVLDQTDATKSVCVIAGNEYRDGEAYFYRHEWQGTPLDPRVYYPDIISNKQGDPLHPCTLEAQSMPQLAIANMMAAASACWLWRFWTVEAPLLQDKGYGRMCFPVHVRMTFNSLMTETMEDKYKYASQASAR